MRNIIILTLLAVLALTGCVRGSGVMTEREDAVSGFKHVEVQGRGRLIITQGETESLVVEAEDNIIGHIESRVAGDKLTIEHKRMLFVRPTQRVVYHLSVRDLESISAVGAVSVHGVTPIVADSLALVVAGAGETELEVNVRSLDLMVAGASDMTLSGAAENFKAEVAGAGDMEAFDLITQHAAIKAAGATSVNITVEQTLAIEASGACDISYRGDAQVIKQELSGSNSISRK